VLNGKSVNDGFGKGIFYYCPRYYATRLTKTRKSLLFAMSRLHLHLLKINFDDNMFKIHHGAYLHLKIWEMGKILIKEYDLSE